MDRKSKGILGEEMALKYLEKKGYEIIERNYRHGKGEIDVIALWQNTILIFIEVKLRKDASYGDPETFVLRKQQNLIIRTAEDYIFSINWMKDIRFDIIAINEELGIIDHIEDAFY